MLFFSMCIGVVFLFYFDFVALMSTLHVLRKFIIKLIKTKLIIMRTNRKYVQSGAAVRAVVEAHGNIICLLTYAL